MSYIMIIIRGFLFALLALTLQGCITLSPQDQKSNSPEYYSALTLSDQQLLSDESLFNHAGYRIKNYRAPVPSIAPYATTLSTAELQQAIKEDEVLLIDVLPTPFRAGKFIDTADHKNIPNSNWLPNTGKGVLDPFTSAYFAKKLHELTAGNRQHKLVFYCKTDCWMSWNACRRAAEEGYQNILWYSEGIDGWQKAGLPLVSAQAIQP